MKKKNVNRGFTLIELLVVVLIIGILAAVALPQYQKAVERARMVEVMQTLDNISKAQNILYMRTGHFATNLQALNSDGDIAIQSPSAELWEYSTSEYTWSEAGTTSHSGGWLTRYTRRNGKYQGGKLSASPFPDGTVRRWCINPSGDTTFCTMAQSAGYICDPVSSGSSSCAD